MFFQKTKPVHAASKRQYTAEGREVQVLWGGIHEWRKADKEIDTRVGKVNTVLRELYLSVVTKRELSNTAELSVFKSVFVPISTYRHEYWIISERVVSELSSARGRDEIFGKSSRYATSRQSADLWNS